MKGLLIAGTASGVGKTTVVLALLAAIVKRGQVVQAFKGGPDFLDTGHHARISGRAARNLDTWMLTEEANRTLFREATSDVDAVVVEGMMGLFDGKSGISETGSSAEIAKLLKLPVVLVLDAAKSARSIAAVVLGFELFDPQLVISGVILNRCASERHFKMLQTAIDASCKTPVLGWLPRNPEITIPERHLGLQTVEEAVSDECATKELTHVLAALAEKHFDLERILALEYVEEVTPLHTATWEPELSAVRIGVARDRAFSFYYENNFDLLRKQGAVLISFSPLNDAQLPSNLDALYFGGGYPELYAEQLSKNLSLLQDIRTFSALGGLIYAECGGMIYLSRQLTTSDGKDHEMVGVLPFAMEMTNKLVRFGYVTVEFTQNCLLGPSGTTIRGHSFHYSHITKVSPTETSYRVHYSLSDREELEGYGVGNTLASYVHLHFMANPLVAMHLVEAARRTQVRYDGASLHPMNAPEITS
ncbi:cobyrinate a,c-diamide synthase [Granulicella arctica]|uniref:cobyrinate a,c-diamide synthase n=1 Tax=Granulicella arctica TaxID=940613 RepID=UPI0021E02FF8|nr:cobyrinate a,c-diamide synthase [Granulicella arctica]